MPTRGQDISSTQGKILGLVAHGPKGENLVNFPRYLTEKLCLASNF